MHKAKGFHNLGALGAFSTARSTCSPTTPCTVLTDPHITKPTMGVLFIQTFSPGTDTVTNTTEEAIFLPHV